MSGGELLIVDPSDRDRDGIQSYFAGHGYVVTALASGGEARARLVERTYDVALIDLDVDEPHGGIALIRYLANHASSTAAVLLTREPSFRVAVDAVRAGAVDVVLKEPGQIDHLHGVVSSAGRRAPAGSGADRALLEEARSVLDESFKVMLGLSRKVYTHLSLVNAPLRPTILVVDGDPNFLREISEQLGDKDWAVAAEMTGGAALDKGTTAPVHIVAARDSLMDLPGSMVIRSIQAQRPEVLGLLYGAKLEQLERGESVDVEEPFRGAAHLVEKLDATVGALGSRAEDRRFIQAFSSDHRAFLRRYADLKLTIDRLLSG